MTVDDAMVKVEDERLRYLVRLFIDGHVPSAATFRLQCWIDVGDDNNDMQLRDAVAYVVERLTRCDFPVYTVDQVMRA